MFYLSCQIKAIMRILLVAATEFEVKRVMDEIGDQHSKLTTHNLQLLITGVGMVATAFALGKHLANAEYDLAINLGIAGSFDRSIALGEIVEVVEDRFSELGAEDDEAFLTIDELGFGESIFKSSASVSDFGQTLKKLKAITVNTVHGNETNIQKLTDRIDVQLESMEGAAFFYACKQAGVPCMQIRAVSNYVEKRNREAWQIGAAIKNLNTFAADLLKRL